MTKQIAIIGGGAAGMMAAIQAAENGATVHLYEKQKRLGSKLFIAGGGRCNITNIMDLRDFIRQFGENGKFLFNAFHRFFNTELMAFFEGLGVPLKTERGGRVFPASDKSSDIIKALERRLNELQVDIHLNAKVKEIIVEGDKVIGIKSEREAVLADAVIVATGGKSYPRTGSTGDGYDFARNLGIDVSSTYPALVPLEVKEDFVSELDGLLLKNVTASFFQNDDLISEEFGEMLFTHYGVSGSIILSQSKRVVQALKTGDVRLEIDLKPALDDATLDDRLIRELDQNGKKMFKNILPNLLPNDLIPLFIRRSQIPPTKRCHQINSHDRKRLFHLFRRFPLTISRPRPIDEALVTAGGVALAEIDPQTMESHKINGLYFCGEVLDLDGDTGGFNLQAAFSTGYIAGVNASLGMRIK